MGIHGVIFKDKASWYECLCDEPSCESKIELPIKYDEFEKMTRLVIVLALAKAGWEVNNPFQMDALCRCPDCKEEKERKYKIHISSSATVDQDGNIDEHNPVLYHLPEDIRAMLKHKNPMRRCAVCGKVYYGSLERLAKWGYKCVACLDKEENNNG